MMSFNIVYCIVYIIVNIGSECNRNGAIYMVHSVFNIKFNWLLEKNDE